MKLTLENDHPMYISQYDEGKIILNNETISHSVCITQNKFKDWQVDPKNLRLEDFEVFEKADVLLIASSIGQFQMDPTLLCHLTQKGLGVEVMTLGALCRTFNLLIQEGRCVAAGLMFTES